jgi:imidazolonepropionase-like amidohydrolase
MAIAIINAKVFDGTDVAVGRRVVIDGGTISETAEVAETIDGTGCTLLPGLIDSHEHLYEDTKYLKMAAQHGVTTMLDMGIRNPAAVAGLRNIPGLTTVFSSCGMIFAKGSKATDIMKFPAYMAVQDVADAERIVGEQVALGADYIKLILEEKGLQHGVDFPVDVGRAVVAQAHKHGKKVIAHAVTNKTFRSGLTLGVDILTHLPFTQMIEPDIVTDMAANGTTLVPTIIMGKCLLEKILTQHPLMVKMKRGMDKIMKHTDAFNFTLDFGLDAFAKLYKAGVRIIAGTDSNMDDPTTPSAVPYGKSLHDELGLYVQAGMTPIEALRSATSIPAEYFGLPGRGYIAVGKRADLLLVKGDPTVNIGDIRNVEKVWINGVEAAK